MKRSRSSAAIAIVLALGVGACAEEGTGVDPPSERKEAGIGVDPTPERKDGSSSYEFEADDIERANNASEAVKDYCDGAVSEAQYVGCLSHVDESDIP